MTQSWSVLEERIKRSVGDRRVPLAGHFELTARCNLSCRMCYVGTGAGNREACAKEKGKDWWLSLAKQAMDAGMLHLLLTGGEVTMLPYFPDLYRELSLLGLFITVNTNATLLDEPLVNLFAAYPPLQVAVTLYGMSQDSCKQVTGNEDAFSATLHALDRLAAGKVPFTVKMPVIKSLLHELEPAADLIRERYGKVLELVDYIEPRREGTGSVPLQERLTPKEYHEFQRSLAEQYKSDEEEVGRFGVSSLAEQFNPDEEEVGRFGVLSDGSGASDELRTSHTSFACLAGTQSFWVTWDGRMTPCGSMSEPSVAIGEMGFDAAWIRLGEVIALVPKCKDCENCQMRDVCMACPARLLLETGSSGEKAPYLCEIAQLLYHELQAEQN